MPLVATNTIDIWYRKDSWVYKNFAYLFQNQLWQKDVPSGFSLCPYFWLALFSMTLFRVFVGVVLTVQLIFKPFGGLLSKIDRFVQHDLSAFQHVRVTGGPTVLATVVTVGVLAVLGLFGTAIWELFAFYNSFDGLVTLITPLVVGTVAIITGVYRSANPRSDCKVEVYSRIVTLAGLAVAYYFHPADMIEVVQAAWYFVGIALSEIWGFILSIPGGIWFGIKYVAVGGFDYIATFFTGAAVKLGSIWIIIGGITLAITYLASRWFPAEKFISDEEEEVRKREEANRILRAIELIADSAYYRHESTDGKDRNKKEWASFIRDNVPEAVALVHQFIKTQERFDSAAFEALAERAIQAALDTNRELTKLAEECERARNQKCKAVTDGLAKAWSTFTGPFVWFGKQAWTFLCLLWELIRAKKTGACPYLKFKDTTQEEPVIQPKEAV